MADSPALNSSGAIKLTIFSNGTPIDETINIVSISVNKSINRIPDAKIVLLDGDLREKEFPVSNSDTFKPGSAIRINAGYGQDEETIFEGIVVKHGLKITGDNYSRLVIECRDKAVAMTLGRKSAHYVDSRDSDIITKLISSYSGLSSDVQATTTRFGELVQYYCTDWDFMLSRAEANGLLVCVDDARLAVKPPRVSGSPALEVTYGEDLIEFHADLDARTQFNEVNSSSWDPREQAVVVEQAAPQTLNTEDDLASADLAAVLNVPSFRLQTAAPLGRTALQDWAKGQQLKAGLSRIRGRMKFQGSAKAKIATQIELDGVGNRFNGNVFVSSVNHEIAQGNWITEVDFGMSFEGFAEQRDLVAPSASGLLPGVHGLQIGVVKRLDADPEGLCRIQVSVPLMHAESDGIWARLATFYASDAFGAFFVPEIGDEVVLGYLNNDPSNPVVLGSLYSSKRKPSYELTADNFTKAVVTRSKLRIAFDDDKKCIAITTPGNNALVLSDDGKPILLRDQNGNRVELSSGGIVLDSPKDVRISAKGKITLDAVGEIGVTSAADVNIKGLNINNSANVGFVAQGNASAELSASGQTTVKGAMVMIN